MIEKKVNLNLLIAFDRVSKQNFHPCLKSRIVGYCYIVNMDDNGTKVFDASYDAWGRQTVTLNTIGAGILHGTGTPFKIIFNGLYHNK